MRGAHLARLVNADYVVQHDAGPGDGAGTGRARSEYSLTARGRAALLDYVQAVVDATRSSPRFVHGLSPRAALALLAVARAWAFLADRRMVMPEDVQAVLPGVACHRLQLADGSGHARPEDIAQLIRAIPVT